MVEKYIKDGKVAVLYSPGFGSGWSTWNSDHAEWCLFDKGLIKIVLANEPDGLNKFREYCTNKWPDKDDPEECELYLGSGIEDLRVMWLNVGTKFRLNEYDGSESIEVLGSVDWYEA